MRVYSGKMLASESTISLYRLNLTAKFFCTANKGDALDVILSTRERCINFKLNSNGNIELTNEQPWPFDYPTRSCRNS